jgi:hypothetical protein
VAKEFDEFGNILEERRGNGKEVYSYAEAPGHPVCTG